MNRRDFIEKSAASALIAMTVQGSAKTITPDSSNVMEPESKIPVMGGFKIIDYFALHLIIIYII